MYFPFWGPRDWGKNVTETCSRNCAVLPYIKKAYMLNWLDLELLEEGGPLYG